MGVVYLAEHVDLRSCVALKELGRMWAADATSIKRFLREAQLAAQLNHRNIVRVYDYFEHEGLPYIAMEVHPRGSLRPLVGRLDLPQILGVLDGILAGLVHACEHQIVHRDLKPENVMRADDGTVKIADFGIAVAHDGLSAGQLTPDGFVVGPAAYVSPEQVHGDKATSASDLYSIGVIAFELLIGEVPFAGSTPNGFLLRKAQERAPSVRSLRPDVDHSLADWVDRLLERAPTKRPRDVVAVRDGLEAIAERLIGPRWRTEGLLPDDVPEPSPPPVQQPTHRFIPFSTVRERGDVPARAAHALVSPWAIGLAVAVLAAAALVDARLLVVVAAAAYAAMAAITFFDDATSTR